VKLLLVEDERRMAQALEGVLSLEGYAVTVCSDGPTGLKELLSGVYDLAVLDVMLPGCSGFEILREARGAGMHLPVLLLTAKNALEDKVEGLDSGADDYLTKPFLMEELLARLRALMRRGNAEGENRLAFGDLSLDAPAATLYCGRTSRSVRLSDKEFRLMEYLMANQGQILSREQLAVRIWGYDNEAEYNNVEVYMSFTRKKLRFLGSGVEIKSVRGLGYELRDGDV
jgi:DNA-binding response OmpR family regulator